MHNLLLADFMVAAMREMQVARGEATWEAEWEQIYGAKTRPDGVLKVKLNSHETNWLVEADTGSETLAQVVLPFLDPGVFPPGGGVPKNDPFFLINKCTIDPASEECSGSGGGSA